MSIASNQMNGVLSIGSMSPATSSAAGGGGFSSLSSTPLPMAAQPASSQVGRTRPEPPRRSRSQGTRKLHKCLSTASYSEEAAASSSYLAASSTAAAATITSAPQRQQLMAARQYCSFGSTKSPFHSIMSNHAIQALTARAQPDNTYNRTST